MNYLYKILNGLALKHPQRKFIIQLFSTWLSIKGRVNFLQLGRFSKHSEKYYRRWFCRPFDWTGFNKALLQHAGIGKCVIAIDDVVWQKAGKKTFGLSNVYSGVMHKLIRGIDFFTLSIVSAEWATAFHINAVQIVNSSPVGNRASQQAAFLMNQLPALRELTKVVVGDGYFARKKYLDAVVSQGCTLISKLRQDAALFYLYTGTTKRGRPRKKDGRINWSDVSKMTYVGRQNDSDIYEAIAFNRKFKRNIKAVYIYDNKSKGYVILMCTDLEMPALEIIEYYRLRFQIEFVYRDAKQHTALTTCQSPKQEAMHFHVNAAMTAINLAKTDLLKENGVDSEMVFSLSDYVQRKSNLLLAERIIGNLGFELSERKIKAILKDSAEFGLIHLKNAA